MKIIRNVSKLERHEYEVRYGSGRVTIPFFSLLRRKTSRHKFKLIAYYSCKGTRLDGVAIIRRLRVPQSVKDEAVRAARKEAILSALDMRFIE